MPPIAQENRPGRGALLFACLFPTFATWLYFIQLAGTGWAMAAYAATKVIQFSFPAAWIWLAAREGTAGGAPAVPGKAAGRGLILAALSGLAILGLVAVSWRPILAASPAFERAPAAVAEKIGSFGIDSGLKFLLLAVFYCVIHSFLEEYYWRWFVFGRLRRSLPFGATAAVSSLAFTSHHVLVVGYFLGSFGLLTFLVSLVVTAAGLLWAWLYERTGRLAGPWISHALADAALMWVGYRMWRG
ncbi:MAG: type II CAAX endopeptidase family protein [Acidobacteriota bacterium]